MNRPQQSHDVRRHPRGNRKPRRGIVVVLTGFLLVGIFAFVSLSVDTGRIVLTETEMQNAVDAAALAASQEIGAAIDAAGQGQGPADLSNNSAAIAAARQVAADVAGANGVFVDPQADVFFGSRRYDEATDSWPIEWGAEPFNVVRVVARRTDENTDAPDGELPLAFGWAVGQDSVPLETSATAFVEARDMVLVLDFSGSMNDDSSLNSSLELSEVERSLDAMWDQLIADDPKWPDTGASKFKPFGRINSYEGTFVSSDNSNTIMSQLGLFDNNGVRFDHIYPQSGRFSNGSPRGELSNSASFKAWRDYVNWVRSLNGPYRKRYGYRTLMAYMQQRRVAWNQSEDLWRTPHYPFHAVKEGASLFLDFLDELNFGDEVGLVSYGSFAVREDEHFDGEVNIDLSEDPISSEYDLIDTIQRRHQAGHYDVFTGIGDGLLNAKELLVGEQGNPNDLGHSRFGASPTIILMTDGRANRSPDGFDVPDGFDWNDWTDYDGDGVADYTTSDRHRKYAFIEAVNAIQRGITVHTMAVGAGADNDLMRAIAFAGNGVFISVPGGSTVAEIETQLLEAFSQIAAKLPPPQLIFDIANDTAQ